MSVESIDKDKAAGVRLEQLKGKPIDLTFKVRGIRFEEAGGAYDLHIIVNDVQIKGLSK